MNYKQVYEESDYDKQEADDARGVGCAVLFWLAVIIVIIAGIALYILL